MNKNSYLMRDLNGEKIDNIMNFNVTSRNERSRSFIEISLFAAAVVGYLMALAVSA
jgi:hypothetical protein